jgi:CMP-2-keto-3-deoxyoctulosonic acid synthetase
MIEHVYRRASEARSVASVIVATDDARIANAVIAFGGEVRMTSHTHRTGTDRIAEVADTLPCDLIVNVQGDEPLIEPAMIDEAVAPFAADASLMLSTLRTCARTARPRRHGATSVCMCTAGIASSCSHIWRRRRSNRPRRSSSFGPSSTGSESG